MYIVFFSVMGTLNKVSAVLLEKFFHVLEIALDKEKLVE